jgi:TPR repeat protein
VKQRIANLFAGSLLAFALFGAAMAGQLEDGAAAYERGDYVAAMSHWRPLAEHGNATAQNFLGLMYQKGRGVPQDYAQAAAWYRKAAAQGDAGAQGMLGGMYLKGHGLSQDDAQAAAWLGKAAAQGLDLAQLDLGVMYAASPCIASLWS